MIVVFPMLTSSTLSNTVIPGICKVLEKYVIVHSIDEIIRRHGGIKEQEVPVPVLKTPPAKDDKTPDIRIDINNKDSVSLEPTWVKIDIHGRSVLVGIKVIPFVVRSDEDLIELLSNDAAKGKIDAILSSKGRNIVASLSKVWRKLWKTVPIVGGDINVSGDPKADIIYSHTLYEQSIFCAMDKSELKDNVYSNPRTMAKLFKLRWSSLVFCDDIKKEAWFCLKKFKGMCSVLPYSYLFASFNSKGLSQAYSDLADAKRSSSPFFKLSAKMSKIFGEAYSEVKKEEFKGK